MKLIQCYINPDRLAALKEKLLHGGVPGMSVDEVMGIGQSRSQLQRFFKDERRAPRFASKLRVEVVVADEAVEEVIKTMITVCQSGASGDGKIFVVRVEEAVRVRTGQRGDAAL